MEYNKKEQLFDKINGLRVTSTSASDTLYNNGVVDALKRVNIFFNNELVPEVPQFVADWYENSKMVLDYAIWDVIQSNAKGNVQSEELNNWIENTEDAIIILVKMYLFGYKVKKEKKYLVKLKGVANGTKALKHNIRADSWYMGIINESIDLKMFHTNEELKAGGFEGVFNNPMFTVVEVEE